MTNFNTRPAHASGTFDLGGDLTITRLGYGTMQLTGPGTWGEPADRENAIRVVRRAADLGVTLFDSADAYGPDITSRILRDALYPYADGIVLATKVGQTRQGPGLWRINGDPTHLRRQVEGELRQLNTERIDLLQLHRIDPAVALEDQIGELKALQDEGKIRHIGLSEVTVAEAEAASKIAKIVSVQNRYNYAHREAEELLDWAAANDVGFIPWHPLATGGLTGDASPLAALAAEREASPAQVALAWLLRRSPVMLPIPGTSNVSHLEDNIRGAAIELSDTEFLALSGSER